MDVASEDDAEPRMLPTQAQQIALSIAPIVTGLLSILGSIGIMTIVLKEEGRNRGRRSQRNTSGVYRRILFCISFFDIISSLNHCSSSFAMPRGTPGVWHPLGTDVTCSIQGFLAQMNFTAEVYAACLAIYYFIEIRAQVNGHDVVRKAEPFMHFIAIVPQLVIASLGLVLDAYGTLPLGVGCWVSDRSETSWLFTIVALIVHTLCAIVIFTCMSGIYYTVRNQMLLMENQYGAVSQQNRSTVRRTRLRRTAWQAFLYVLAWMNTYIWVGVARLLEDFGASDGFFGVRMMSAIFFPLQGFCNFLIFVRPRWHDLRRRFPNESSPGLLKKILAAKPGTYTRSATGTTGSRRSMESSFRGAFITTSSSNLFRGLSRMGSRSSSLVGGKVDVSDDGISRAELSGDISNDQLSNKQTACFADPIVEESESSNNTDNNKVKETQSNLDITERSDHDPTIEKGADSSDID